MVFSATGNLFEFASSSMQQVIERHNLHPKNLGKMDQLSLELQLENGTPYAMLSKEIEEKTHELRKIRGEELPGMDIEELQKLEKELEVGLSRVIETKGERFLEEITSLQQKSKHKSNLKGAKSQSSDDDVVEVPPPMTGGALVEKVMTTQLAATLGVEKEPPNGGVAEEVRQAVKDAQPILPFASLAVQDLETLQPPIPQDPKPVQTPSPTKTMTLEPTTELALGKESLGGVSSSTQAGQTSAQSAPEATPSLESEESSERSKGQEEEPPMMAEVAAQTPKEALPQGASTDSLVVEAQAGIPQTVQRVESPLAPEGGDATMEEVSGMTVSDPGSGLLTFLARFDSLEFNSLPASHFHRFGPPFGNFLRFSVPIEGLPLLEGLFKIYGNFTSGFKGGVFLGNVLMELLCAVLISLRDSSLDSMSEERLLEWRGVVQDLMEVKFNLSFLLEYLRSLAHMLFQRKAFKDLDVDIAVAEEALAHAHKVLQDLRVKKQLVLSSSPVLTISSGGSLLTSLIP
nr:mads-box protein jointless [Quercus suber]